ncbi:MAG: efflux RND transporter periplasmic adaptor subunit [Dysgonamonadaceae bacterium]|jgi:HlyD family secretion protein|nr:efflux RND transporter periplasmic adaptor subunit [Dysgonamonadaceae bacterium]
MKGLKLKHLGYAILLITIIAGALLIAENQSQEQTFVSQTISPQRGTISVKKVISGNLYPVKEIEVKSAISGALETYYVSIGDKVKKGDKIAKIKIISEPSRIENARMNMKTAEFVYEKDKLNYEREKRLFEKGVISANEFEEANKTFQVSREQYEYMKNQLHLLVEGYIPSSNVSNVVTATANGVITDLPQEEGSPVIERNTFSNGTTIATVAQLDSFLFKGRIVENDVLALKKGMKLKVMPSSMDGFATEAIVRKIAPKGYLEQGIMKYDVEAVFTLPDTIRIYSGFNALAELVLVEKKDILIVPESCLSFRNDSVFVSVLKQGKVELRQIETGISDEVNIEVVSGISDGDKILKKKTI